MNISVQNIWFKFLKAVILLLFINILTNCAILQGNYEQSLRLKQLIKEAQHSYYIADYSSALKKWEQSLNLARQVEDQYNIGVSLTNIGKIYLKLDKYTKSLQYYEQSLEVFENINNKYYIWFNLAEISIVYNLLNKEHEFLYYNKQALIAYRKLSNQINSDAVMRFVFFAGIVGYMLYTIKKSELEYYSGLYFNKLGMFHLNAKNYTEAFNYHKKALEIHQKLNDKYQESIDLNNIGLVHKSIGEYKEAKDFFQNSINIKKSIGLNDIWLILRDFASIEAKLGNFESAIKHYEQSIFYLEKVRNLMTEENKILFMRQKIHIYDELIDLLYLFYQEQPEKGYNHLAFKIFEHKQGRIFLEKMAKSGIRRFNIPEKVLQKQQSIIKKQSEIKIKLFEQLAVYNLQQNISSLNQQLNKLEREKTILKEYFKIEHPEYYALQYPQPVNLGNLQKKILQQDEIMLVYNVMEENTILWIIGKNQFQMFTLPVSEKTLKQDVAKLRSYLSNSSFNTKFPQASLNLYKTLLPQKLKQAIKNAEILYIIPTGPLYGLPFGSLVTSYKPKKEIKYLIEDYAISYLSSASLLKIVRDAKRTIQPPKQFLAFANPEYPLCGTKVSQKSDTFAQLRTEAYLKSTKGNCFSPLEDTAKEVKEIANLFNGNYDLYLEADASRSNIFSLNEQDKLDDYRYVMFSVHGIIPNRSNQLEQPALVLSNPLTEGYLTMADAFSLKLNADFVNLSACNTGCADNSCSENVRGEGIMGLTRAFMYAGTSRVGVTLWSVDLHSAKDLSVGLFTNLKAGKKMAQALREIKLKMIRGEASSPRYVNPYHWAAFVVYGDGQ